MDADLLTLLRRIEKRLKAIEQRLVPAAPPAAPDSKKRGTCLECLAKFEIPRGKNDRTYDAIRKKLQRWRWDPDADTGKPRPKEFGEKDYDWWEYPEAPSQEARYRYSFKSVKQILARFVPRVHRRGHLRNS
jgi:hypothetical protein